MCNNLDLECDYGFYCDLENYEYNIFDNEYQHIKIINKNNISKFENDNLTNCIIFTTYIGLFGLIFII